MAKKNKQPAAFYGREKAYDTLKIPTWSGAPKAPKGDKYKSPFSDFERNWYIEQGYKDPNKIIRDEKIIEKTEKLPGRGGFFGNAIAKKVFEKQASYTYQGVTQEARNKFLEAFKDVPITKDSVMVEGDLYNKQEILKNKTGVGTIFQKIKDFITPEDTAPTLQDPNQGRNILKILGNMGRRFF